jgi:hypothetical protein
MRLKHIRSGSVFAPRQHMDQHIKAALRDVALPH